MVLFEKVKDLLKGDVKFVIVLYNDNVIGIFFLDEENNLREYHNVYDTVKVEDVPPCYSSLRNEAYVNKYYNDENLISFKTFINIEEFLNYIKEEIKKEVNEQLKNEDSNASKIYDGLKNDVGKIINFSSKDRGILLCASSTDEDYYWIYVDEYCKIHGSSCVGKYQIEENVENYPKLLALSKDKNKLKKIIDKFQEENTTDYIFTNLTYFN